ncbi:MAG TPA: CRISPR-associated protein Csx11 [Anaerolineae bacterium]|nr:CRISPR-associated protein Csx11 [Anaerolineae bacterium]
MSESLLEKAKALRELVLRAELAGWLHDLGKLSAGFLLSKTDPAYATLGMEERSKTSHHGKWVHGDVFEYDQPCIPNSLADFLTKALPLPEGLLTEKRPSIVDLVANHHKNWGKLGVVEKLLKQADRLDSGEDEYNAIGPQREPVQVATVFGQESPVAEGELSRLDEIRQNLYGELASLLKKFPSTRKKVWACLQEALRQGLGKTQRAANDIRLDQHIWGVATRFKAFLLRDLLDPPTGEQKYPRCTFRLLTVHWDAWEAIIPYARLSDVVGRIVMLGRLKEKVRCLIEEEYAIGNRIYEDDHGVHFLVADLDWGEELERKVRHTVNEATDGDIQPVVKLSDSTDRVTNLVREMDAARHEVPVVREPLWVQKWSTTASGEVCPVCQRRPLEGERDLCKWCELWRAEGIEERRARSQGTVWIGEIADESGRVALLLGRFDLRRWLDGTLLHTLFINSPQDLAYVLLDPKEPTERITVPVKTWKDLYDNVLKMPQEFLRPVSSPSEIRDREEEVRNWGRNKEIEGALAHWLVGQHGRLQRIAEAAQGLDDEPWPAELTKNFLLVLARKNPSASRLLRVWQTTEEFLQRQANSLKSLLQERKRVVLTLDCEVPSGLYITELPARGEVELFVSFENKTKAQTVVGLTPEETARLSQVLRDRKIHLRSNKRGRTAREDRIVLEVEDEPYLPFQVITTSPTLLLAMVPAGVAMEAAERLQQAYAAEFGKVQGRLPFHVGIIFMNHRYPMFAALDTARRLAEGFDSLGEGLQEAEVEDRKETPTGHNLCLASDRFGRWTWLFPSQRGDGEVDWYHPYLLVKAGEHLMERGMSLAGPYGRWVHVSEVKKEDRVALWPNLFDFVFLDTVSRRLEAHVDLETGRRRHPLLGTSHSPRPYPLERLTEFKRVWDEICNTKGMSETRLQAASTLLARKWRLWNLTESDEYWESWKWLVANTVARWFNDDQTILDAIIEGTFFDVVELYRHILKRKVEVSQGEEVEG